MFGWLKELLDIRIEYKQKNLELSSTQTGIESNRTRDENVCLSCETLKTQLGIANQEKKFLMEQLLHKPANVVQPVIENQRAVLPTRHLGFAARRQALEAESRANARLLAEKQRESQTGMRAVNGPDYEKADSVTVDDLEEALDLAALERESQTGVK